MKPADFYLSSRQFFAYAASGVLWLAAICFIANKNPICLIESGHESVRVLLRVASFLAVGYFIGIGTQKLFFWIVTGSDTPTIDPNLRKLVKDELKCKMKLKDDEHKCNMQRHSNDIFTLAIIEKNAIFRLGALPAVARCLGFVPCDCLPTLTFLSARNVIHAYPKDTRTNKFTILGTNRPSGKARKRWNI